MPENSLSEVTQTCPEAPRDQPSLENFNKRFTCVNVRESRTRTFIGELERRGFESLELHAKVGWSGLIAFARSVRRSDFVLFGEPHPSQIPWIAVAKLLGRPCLIDYPMDLMEWPFGTSWRSRLLLKWTLRFADYVLTIRSRWYLVDKLGLKPQRVLLLENCPDLALLESSANATARFHPRPGSFVICCSGCHAAHRLERFMPAFNALTALVPDLELLIIGDPELSSVKAFKSSSESMGLTHQVHFLPVIKPLEDFYATLAQCHMWIATFGDDTLQGQHELRMELLEAGTLRKPVVAARTPAMVENNLEDGRELIFIDPSDPEGSAKKLARYIERPALLAEIGARLRSCVLERFSLRDAMDKLLKAVAKDTSAIQDG